MPPVWFAWVGRPSSGTASVYLLKTAPFANAEDRLSLVKEERKSVDDLIFTSIGIISINQTKRHVKNGHLNTNLSPNAAAKVGEFIEQALVKSNNRITLGLAAQEDRLQSGRQPSQRVNRTDSLGVDKFALRNQTVVTRNQSEAGSHGEVAEILAGCEGG